MPPSGDIILDFAELARIRSDARADTAAHLATVLYFKNDGDSSFFKTAKHKEDGPPTDGRLHGITTTFTCAESLATAPEGRSHADAVLDVFVPRALAAPIGDWASEGAAKVYCRVRSLAPLLTFRNDNLLDSERTVVSQLLKEAWKRVSYEPGTEAIFEVDRAKNGNENRYPPNAYLTYFGLVALEAFPEAVPRQAEKKALALQWLEKALASQIALHYQGSVQADPQQLAWAICGIIRFRPDVLVARVPPSGDLIEAGLRAFFAQQRGGTWERGEPLFHYPEAGNAYCYVFETLGELVRLAVDQSDRALVLSRMLRGYARQLADSMEYLRSTARPLPGSKLVGWCSGHHPHRTSPESWATASVFTFLQAARRLFGLWTRDEVARLLGAEQPMENEETLRERGRTWGYKYGSAGSQLSTLFLQPLKAAGEPKRGDPDVAAMGETNARSAILFGPPGTGKTTLVKAIAGSLGWPFIEITPAVFLEKGVEHVSERADEVFRQVMELDRCVVLFDEIDELIRIRDAHSHALERFFTTTMLPRLAKLWGQRKVLFFVNTNSVTNVDPAIRRSNRFDAAIFVLPPSFEKKAEMLQEYQVGISLTKDRVDDLLKGQSQSVPENEQDVLWFGLISYEQVKRLATRLVAEHGSNITVSDLQLSAQLSEFGKELMGSDWHDPENAMTTRERVIELFGESLNQERIDHGRLRVVATSEMEPFGGAVILKSASGGKASYWKIDVPEPNLELWARSNQARLNPAGYLART